MGALCTSLIHSSQQPHGAGLDSLPLMRIEGEAQERHVQHCLMEQREQDLTQDQPLHLGPGQCPSEPAALGLVDKRQLKGLGALAKLETSSQSHTHHDPVAQRPTLHLTTSTQALRVWDSNKDPGRQDGISVEAKSSLSCSAPPPISLFA